MLKTVINTVLLLLFPLMLSSCVVKFNVEQFNSDEDEKAREETHIGRNTFSFTIDGELIRQRSTLHRDAYYSGPYVDGKIIIRALLANKIYRYIELLFYSEDLKENEIINPQVIFEYYYRTEQDGTRIHREYKEVTITESEMIINYFKGGILAGHFSLLGEYPDSTGVIHHININDGLFDLTDSIHTKKW